MLPAMDAIATSRSRSARPTVLIAVILALMGAFAGIGPVHAQDASPAPGAASPAASVPADGAAGLTACQSAADLRLYVGFLRSQSLSEDGLVPILVGIAATVYEADRLLGLVDATYRPLVAELVASARALGTSVRELRASETIGAGLAQLGEAITRLGLAMDALSTALREPCPPDPSPVSSVAPAASPAA
jgi:hypothetical protein